MSVVARWQLSRTEPAADNHIPTSLHGAPGAVQSPYRERTMSERYAGRFHAPGASTLHGMTPYEGGSVKYKG